MGTCLIDLVPLDGKLGQQGGAGPGREGRNVDHVCFRVLPWKSADILAHLSAHGINAEVASRYGADGEGQSVYVQDPEGNQLERSEERRGGKGCGSTCRSRWWPDH